MGREGAQTGRGLERRISRSPGRGPERHGEISRRPSSRVLGLAFRLGALILAACGASKENKPNIGRAQLAALVDDLSVPFEEWNSIPPEMLTTSGFVPFCSQVPGPGQKIRWSDRISVSEEDIKEAPFTVSSDGTIDIGEPIDTVYDDPPTPGVPLVSFRTATNNEFLRFYGGSLSGDLTRNNNLLIDGVFSYGSEGSGREFNDVILTIDLDRERGFTDDQSDVARFPEDYSGPTITTLPVLQGVVESIPEFNQDPPDDPNEVYEETGIVVSDRCAVVTRICRRDGQGDNNNDGLIGDCITNIFDNTDDVVLIPYDSSIGNWDPSQGFEIASTDTTREGALCAISTPEAECIFVSRGPGGTGSVAKYKCSILPAPDPDAGPPDTDFNCSGGSTCVEVADGTGSFETAEACLADCVPPPDTDYTCSPDDTCTEVPNGDGPFETQGECETSCIPPPMGYECDRSSYVCNEVPEGIYGDRDTCERECEPPPVLRYRCNDGTGECFADDAGEFEELAECETVCEPPTRYTCNEGTDTCFEDAGGTYPSLEGCEATCVTPDMDFNCSPDFTCVEVAEGTAGSFETRGDCEAVCVRPPDPDAGPPDAELPPDGPQDGPLPDKEEPKEDGPREIPDDTGGKSPRDAGSEDQDARSQTEMPVPGQPPGCGACDVSGKPAEESDGKGFLALAALAGAFLSRRKNGFTARHR